MDSERVAFTSQGLTLAGDLRIPDGSPLGGPERPAGADADRPAQRRQGPATGRHVRRPPRRRRVRHASPSTTATSATSRGSTRTRPASSPTCATPSAISARGPRSTRTGSASSASALGGGYAVRAGAFDPRVRAIAGVGRGVQQPGAPPRDRLGPDGYRGMLAGALANMERASEKSADVAYLPACSVGARRS